MDTDKDHHVLIDEDDHLLKARTGADALVVYFTALNVERRRFNFVNLAQTLPAHALFVNDLSQSWYQNGVAGLGSTLDETCIAIRHWAERLGVRRIVAVGSSMGAFGALLTTRVPGCAALAFSPEGRLGLPGSRSRKSCKGGIAPRTADLREYLKGQDVKATIIFGESEPMDLSAAAHLSAVDGMEVIGLRGVDHYASTHLNRAGVLGASMERFIATGRIGDLHSLHPAPRAEGVWRPLAGVGSALGARRYPEALLDAHLAEARADWTGMLRQAEQAVSLYPQGDAGWRLLGRALLASGRVRDALAPLSASIVLAENDPMPRYLLANALRKLGLEPEARRHLGIITRRWPDFGRAYYELSLLAEASNELDEAVRVLRLGIQMEPHRLILHEKLNGLLQRTSGAARTRAAPGRPWTETGSA